MNLLMDTLFDVDALHVQAQVNAEFHKRFLESLVVQPIPGSLDAFAAYLHKDSAKWAKVISAANLKID